MLGAGVENGVVIGVKEVRVEVGAVGTVAGTVVTGEGVELVIL